MELPPGLLQAIAQTHLFTDGQRYVVLQLTPTCLNELGPLLASQAVPFSAFILDKNEITLWLTSDLWDSMKPMLSSTAGVSPPYRLITLDIALGLTLVGYMAMFASVLAEAGISIMTIAAFSRDHILVPEDDFERAWDVLWAWIRSCQAQETAISK